MGNMAAFKDRLKELRLSRHMNRTELERFCDLHRGSISIYEKGARYPDVFTLVKICKGLNVSADWLLGLKEDVTWKFWKKK